MTNPEVTFCDIIYIYIYIYKMANLVAILVAIQFGIKIIYLFIYFLGILLDILLGVLFAILCSISMIILFKFMSRYSPRRPTRVSWRALLQTTLFSGQPRKRSRSVARISDDTFSVMEQLSTSLRALLHILARRLPYFLLMTILAVNMTVLHMHILHVKLKSGERYRSSCHIQIMQIDLYINNHTVVKTVKIRKWLEKLEEEGSGRT